MRKRVLIPAVLLALLVPGAPVAGAKVTQRQRNFQTCVAIAVIQPGVDDCTAALRKHSKGPFGILGPTVRGWTAAWCFARAPWRDDEWLTNCPGEREGSLRREGYRDSFFGIRKGERSEPQDKGPAPEPTPGPTPVTDPGPPVTTAP